MPWLAPAPADATHSAACSFVGLREPIVTSCSSSTSLLPIVLPTLPVPRTPIFIVPPPAGAYDRGMSTLRVARATEATLLAELQERASVAAFPDIFPPERFPFPRDAVHERWTQALEDPAASVLLAQRAEEAVGVALLRPDWLEGLYVLPEWWGKGVADELHDRGLEIVRDLGSAQIHLWVLEGNTRAKRFYERRGWQENGRTRVVPYPPNPLDVGYTLDF